MSSKPGKARSAPVDPYAFLSSPIFTLTIDPPIDDTVTATTPTTATNNDDASSGSTLPESAPNADLLDPLPLQFHIHKSLLASLSPELHNHVHNTMREGLTSSMHLREVDHPTILSFLTWAYKGSYPDHPFYTGDAPEDGDCYPATLVQHAKLYVFAERFNVEGLKRHIYDKMGQLLKDLTEGGALEIDWVGDRILEAMGICFEELPEPGEALLAVPVGGVPVGKILCDVCGKEFPSNNQRWKHLRATDHHRPRDHDELARPVHLLRWFCQFLAYNIVEMKAHATFWQLMRAFPLVQRAVFQLLGPAAKAPWGVQRPSAVGESHTAKSARNKRTASLTVALLPADDGRPGSLRYTLV